MSSSNVVGDSEGPRHVSCNFVKKQISFQSPRGRDIAQAVRISSSNQVNMALQQSNIPEAESEGSSSEKSDTSSSSSNDSGDDSSIDAAINGEEDTEQALYDKILAAQEGREAGSEESKQPQKQVEELVDKNMINLLRVCTMLQPPKPEEIASRKVTLGPQTKQKLLILDMDETLLHSRFHKLTG